MIHGDHGQRNVAFLRTNACGAQRGEERFRAAPGRSLGAEGGQDGGNAILADGRIVEAWAQWIGCEDGSATDAGYDDVDNVGSVVLRVSSTCFAWGG